MNGKIYSVSELNNKVKSLIESELDLRVVSVEGEITNFKRNAISGHCYFSLKDANSIIACVIWKGNAARLAFLPKEGDKVTCNGKVSVYVKGGSYQLIADEILPKGQGDLFLAFEQLKTRLNAEGLFEKKHKKPIPLFPERIGVITSGTGAAVRDIIRILGCRWPMSKVVVLPVRVQGEGAPAEIVSAIQYANIYQVVDVLIVGRGGGSLEDLWAFNDERLARAIYASEIPVISAVGHEPDFTISDFVADCRASTPSNAAEIVVPDQNEIRERIRSARARQLQSLRKKLDTCASQFMDLASRNVILNPASIYQNQRMSLAHLSDSLQFAEDRILSSDREKFIAYASSLEALSPLKVLSRGYSVVTDAQGRTVTSVNSIQSGDMIDITLLKGRLNCKVNSKEDSL